MKKVSHIKETLLQATFGIILFAAAILVLSGCNQAPKPQDTKEIAEDHNKEMFDSRKQEKDAQFLVNAAALNLEEIQLAQLAQQRGNSAHVKELAKMMETTHTKMQADLTALAQAKAVTIPGSPTEESKKAYEKLNEKSAADFDKEYADMAVSNHKEAVREFEKASDNAHDDDVQNWATASLPELRTHLEHSEACQEKCKNEKKK